MEHHPQEIRSTVRWDQRTHDWYLETCEFIRKSEGLKEFSINDLQKRIATSFHAYDFLKKTINRRKKRSKKEHPDKEVP